MIFRCEALDFRISKSQKKILKHVTKFLKNELTNDNAGSTDEDQQDNIGKIFRILKNLFVIVHLLIVH